MILDVTTLQRLDEAMTAAHRQPQPCGHPKSALGICSDCGTVLCVACESARELHDCHGLHCRGGILTA